ncbi:GNAT family N-acetyltransferase [Fangia hongkongensis]|uniref:GNAT family N-acetyltransferase n=1 Tax=Fangia hongkongensis TaxID=270495 RepID=UPI00036C0FFC|nr:GNAT family N-acetyltransferase [Fangia hongkongensis]MBK2126074.1 GNAT family N-acetyltransferase [Fangia hongkongensis]
MDKAQFKPFSCHLNLLITPRKTTDSWDDYSEIHFDANWHYGSDREQRDFLLSHVKEYKALCQRNKAMRFVAYLEGIAVGDLGIHWHGDIGRFNAVGVHRNYRNRGIAKALISYAAHFAFEQLKLKRLIIVAVTNYHAFDLYQSLGFQAFQTYVTLEKINP